MVATSDGPSPPMNAVAMIAKRNGAYLCDSSCAPNSMSSSSAVPTVRNGRTYNTARCRNTSVPQYACTPTLLIGKSGADDYAAVDREHRAGDELRRIGSEPQVRVRDVVRIA